MLLSHLPLFTGTSLPAPPSPTLAPFFDFLFLCVLGVGREAREADAMVEDDDTPSLCPSPSASVFVLLY